MMGLKRVLKCLKGDFSFMPWCILYILVSLSFFSSTSTHNQEVKRKIVQEIKDVPGVSYTEEEIKGKNV